MQKSQKQINLEQEGKVYNFLKKNPLSTSDEIYAAIGPCRVVGLKYIRGKKYEGRWVWRLNIPKMKRDGLI